MSWVGSGHETSLLWAGSGADSHFAFHDPQSSIHDIWTCLENPFSVDLTISKSQVKFGRFRSEVTCTQNFNRNDKKYSLVNGWNQLIVLLLYTMQTAGCTLGSKPCLVFAGDLFETDSEYTRLKNLLIGTLWFLILRSSLISTYSSPLFLSLFFFSLPSSPPPHLFLPFVSPSFSTLPFSFLNSLHPLLSLRNGSCLTCVHNVLFVYQTSSVGLMFLKSDWLAWIM